MFLTILNSLFLHSDAPKKLQLVPKPLSDLPRIFYDFSVNFLYPTSLEFSVIFYRIQLAAAGINKNAAEKHYPPPH